MPTLDDKVLPFNHEYVARRRKYTIRLAAILGSLVACALAVGIVEALRARSMRRLVNTKPLDAGISGEGLTNCGYRSLHYLRIISVTCNFPILCSAQDASDNSCMPCVRDNLGPNVQSAATTFLVT